MALNRTSQSSADSGTDIQATSSTKTTAQNRTNARTSSGKDNASSRKTTSQKNKTVRAQISTRETLAKRDASSNQTQVAEDNDSSETTTVRPARVQISKQSATGTTQNAYEAVGLQISFSVPIVAGLDSAPST